MGFQAGHRSGWLPYTSHVGRKLGQCAETLHVNSMGMETSLQCLLFSYLLEHVSELPKTHFTQPQTLFLMLVRSEGREP